MNRFALCNLVVLLCATVIAVRGQERPVAHMLTGIVVDENDSPVEGAHVCALPSGGLGGRVPCNTSNAKGEFSILIQWVGTYTVTAEDLKRGYPDASSFYGPGWQALPRVTIAEASDPDPVEIKFAQKAGRLVLTILDGVTNRQITGGCVVMSRPDRPLSKMSVSTAWPQGHYEILTPDGPFNIKFQTSHVEWVDRKAFDESGLPVETLQVDLGARKEMTIKLN